MVGGEFHLNLFNVSTGQQTTWVVSLSIAGSEMMTFEKEQPRTWVPINCAMLPITLAADWWFARCLNLTRIDFDRRLKLGESSGRFRDCCFSGFCLFNMSRSAGIIEESIGHESDIMIHWRHASFDFTRGFYLPSICRVRCWCISLFRSFNGMNLSFFFGSRYGCFFKHRYDVLIRFSNWFTSI